MAALAVCGLLTFGAGTASAAEPPDIAQLVAAMQQEGQNAAEKAAFTGGGYRASLARAAETAAQAAAAAPVSAPAQEDPGETGGDEEPSEPAPVTQHSIHDENGYYVHNGSAYNSITKDGLWVGGTDENTGFHVDSDGNVTTTGSITVNRTGGAGSVTIDASTGKITGVTAGDISSTSTDAVNGSQLYNAIQGAEGTTYAAGDGVVIADGSTTGEDKTISVKAGNGIEVGADGVAVKVNGNNLTVNENGLSLSETLSGLTSVTASGTITAGNVKINADNSGKITGLADGEINDTSTDAVTGKQLNDVKEAAEELDGLAVKYTNKNKTAVDLGSATLTTTGAVTGGSFNAGSVVVDGTTNTITGLSNKEWNGTPVSGQAATEDQLKAVADADKYVTGGSINSTDGTLTLNQAQTGIVTISGLKDYVSGIDTYVTSAKIDGTKLTINKNHGDAVEVDLSGLADGLSTSDYHLVANPAGGNYKVQNGKVELTVQNGDNTADKQTVTIEGIASTDDVKALDNLAVKYTNENKTAVDLNTATLTTTGSITGGSFVVNDKTYISDEGLNANGQKIIGVADGTIGADSKEAVNGGQLQQVYDAMKEIDGTTYADGDGISISGGDNTISVNAGKGLEIADDKVQVNLKDDEKNLELLESGELTLKDALNVTSVTAGNGFLIDSNTSFTSAGLTVGGKTYVSSDGLNANGSVITGVGDAKDADDAVNLGQLNEKLAGLTVEGTTYTAGNGIDIDDTNQISAKADEKNVTVGENGIALKDNISVTSVTTSGNVTAGGALDVTGATTLGSTLAVTGDTTLTGTLTANGAATFNGTATFTKGASMNNQKITGVLKGEADTDAVNVGQLNEALKDVEGTTYAAGNNGVTVDNEKDTISAKVDEGKNLTIGDNGIALKDDISVTSVTATGAITGSSFVIDDKTYISGDGLNANSQKITNVLAGEVKDGSTDAVNGDQLAAVQSQIKDYTAGDGINIGDDDTISVKYGNGLGVDNGSLTVKGYEGITVDAKGVSVNLASNSGLGFDRGALYIMTPRGGNIEITEDGLDLADEVSGLTSLSAGTLTATNSLTAGSIIVDGKTYISSSGLNANGVITGVTAGTISASSTEAVNGSQLFEIKQVSDLAVTYTSAAKDRVELGKDGNNATLTHVADGALSGTSTDAVNGKQLYVVDEKVGDAEWKTSHWLVEEKDLTSAVSILDSKIGNLEMGQLDYLKGTQTSVTSALYGLNEAIGPVKFTAGNYITDGDNLTTAAQKLDLASSAIANAIGVQKNEEGGLSTTINWSSDLKYVHSGDTIATGVSNLDRAMQDLDDRVLTLEGKNPAGQSLAAFSNMSAANVSALSALSNMDTETAETLASMSSEQVETLAAKAPAAAPAAPAPGDPTATSTRPGPDGESETGDTGDAYEVDQDLHVTGDTTLGGALTVDGAGTFNDGLTVNTKTEGGTALTVNGGASINGTLNMNDNKITGVADGEISETSTDAVNGSQLWGVQQDIENNASAIASLGGQVSRLDNRIDRVGAGAAALAALHPLDYDPEVKWDFAAGYGNYRGANAVSVGAFYRPNEDVMFSVGGSMGGGENMVNAGVSFKLGSGSGLTTSRTAMARELAAMKDTVAAQNAQIEAQAKQIEELTALVAQLAAEKAGAPEEKKA